MMTREIKLGCLFPTTVNFTFVWDLDGTLLDTVGQGDYSLATLRPELLYRGALSQIRTPGTRNWLISGRGRDQESAIVALFASVGVKFDAMILRDFPVDAVLDQYLAHYRSWKMGQIEKVPNPKLVIDDDTVILEECCKLKIPCLRIRLDLMEAREMGTD